MYICDAKITSVGPASFIIVLYSRLFHKKLSFHRASTLSVLINYSQFFGIMFFLTRERFHPSSLYKLVPYKDYQNRQPLELSGYIQSQSHFHQATLLVLAGSGLFTFVSLELPATMTTWQFYLPAADMSSIFYA